MEKVFEMHRKRVIKTLQAVKQYPNLVVYLDEEFIDGKLVSSEQGITTREIIQAVGKTQPVKDYEKKYKGKMGESKKGVKMAHRQTFREELRKKGMGGIKWENLGFEENPYDTIQLDGVLDMDNLGEYEIFYLNTSSHLVEGLDEKPVPQGLKFDYMGHGGGIDDGKFDLKKILEAIKDRSDIDWLNREKEPKITDIPYYNSERNRTSQLDFRWMPSDKDYEVVYGDDSIKWGRTFQDVIMEKIFGLNLEDCLRRYTAEELAEDEE